jgi:putative heme-binding domain-containing protein
LLLERDQEQVLDALKINWKQNRLTRSRLPVLWLMRILDPRLTPAVLAWGEIDNRDPRVREQVFSLIGENLDELLPDDVQTLAAEETDDRVRFRLALDLSGRSQDPLIERRALIRLLDRGAEDPWLRIAVGTMKSDPPGALVSDLLDHWTTVKKLPAGATELTEELSEIVGVQLDPKSAKSVLPKIIEFSVVPRGEADAGIDVSAAGIRGFGRGALRHGFSFAAFRTDLNATEKAILSELMQSVRTIALNPRENPPRRLAAIRTMAYAEPADAVMVLLSLSFSDNEISIRLAALDVLSSLTEDSIGPSVMAQFDAQTPQLRRAILDVMLALESRTALLLTALEKGDVKLSEIDPTRQIRLTKHRNKDLSARAEKLFAAAISPDRAAVMEKYRAAAEAKGDATRGRQVFEKNCVTCHRVANMGVNVGPDIGDTRDKLPAYLLTNILDPNRVVDANYFAYTVVTKQGKPYTGLIRAETAVSITIRMPEGKEETILRSDIDEFKTSGVSLMPIGLEKNITVEQMTDLISFLKNWRYLDGSIPLPE